MTTETIRAETTGSVWKIEARPGDILETDGTVIDLGTIICALLKVAPDFGRLLKLLVAEGDSVKDGQDLAVIETE